MSKSKKKRLGTTQSVEFTLSIVESDDSTFIIHTKSITLIVWFWISTNLCQSLNGMLHFCKTFRTNQTHEKPHKGIWYLDSKLTKTQWELVQFIHKKEKFKSDVKLGDVSAQWYLVQIIIPDTRVSTCA